MAEGKIDYYGFKQHDHEFREHVEELFKDMSQEYLAEKRFIQFVRELSTAMDNTHKTLDNVAFNIGLTSTPSNYYEAKGRADAWGEIYERFNKEVRLATQKMDYRLTLDEEAYNTLRAWKNERVDFVLPENKVRGSREGSNTRRRFADSIDESMYFAYCLGKRNAMFEKMDDSIII